MSNETTSTKIRNGANSTFRDKPKTGKKHRLPLDLKPESPKLREIKQIERRKKGFRLAAMILMGMSLVALGRAALNETLFQNPRFILREIKVVTQGMLTEDQIQAACGTSVGVNLLTINLRDVRERVMQMPAVTKASVHRDFSGTVTIEATQRQPVAWVKCAKQHWLPKTPLQGLVVDAEGIAIPAMTVLPEYDALPVIEDETMEKITPGRPVTSPRFVACMKLLQELGKRQQQGGDRLLTLRVPGTTYAIEALFASQARVTFSYDDLPPQLARYDRFAAEAKQKHWTIDTLNLVAEHNIPVTFRVARSATAAPAAIPVAPQVAAVTTPARTSSSSTRAARNSSGGKSSRKSASH